MCHIWATIQLLLNSHQHQVPLVRSGLLSEGDKPTAGTCCIISGEILFSIDCSVQLKILFCNLKEGMKLEMSTGWNARLSLSNLLFCWLQSLKESISAQVTWLIAQARCWRHLLVPAMVKVRINLLLPNSVEFYVLWLCRKQITFFLHGTGSVRGAVLPSELGEIPCRESSLIKELPSRLLSPWQAALKKYIYKKKSLADSQNNFGNESKQGEGCAARQLAGALRRIWESWRGTSCATHESWAWTAD